MSKDRWSAVLPYSYVVGQKQLKLALELNHVAPGIGGVLISGERGTAKSTVVRAFGLMVHGQLPVTLPINATDDRVVGGWRLDALMESRVVEQKGLLELAGERGVLYVDEVNLLDDHVVNIILDVAATGILTVQREGADKEMQVDFGLVGTMNPDEGGLRPQLLDRFGLMVEVHVEADPKRRREILQIVLALDEARAQPVSDFLAQGRALDSELRQRLDAARARLYTVDFPYKIAALCADVAASFQATGHRGDVVIALAARALAAWEFAGTVAAKHVRAVAPMALRHRRTEAGGGVPQTWDADDDKRLDEIVFATDDG